MGFLQSYSFFLLKHPCKILIVGVSLVIALLFLTVLIRPIPSFRDPLVGFEARGTLISSRINTWKLLIDETSASYNNLSMTANSHHYEYSQQSYQPNRISNDLNPLSPDDLMPEPPVIEESLQDIKKASSDTYDEDEEEYYRSINSTQEIQPTLMHYSLGSAKAFCGKLYEGYAQVIISPSTRFSSTGLFNLNSMLAICQLDQKLRLEQTLEDSAIFQKDCERFQLDEGGLQDRASACCNSWSFPNYIACLSNKTSCNELDSQDMKNTENLLNICAPYYFKAPYEECFSNSYREKQSSLNILSGTAGVNQWPPTYCKSIPDKCLRCDGWIFTVLNYLSNDNFVFNRNITSTRHDRHRTTTPTKESIINKLTYTNIFLPIAKSSSLMKYYQALSKYNLKTRFAQVKAMELGLKNSLFEHLVSDDTRLFVIALVGVLLVISIYIWSVILSLVILMIICLSLCSSYTIYELVFNIPAFPFMNLLAVVISFGICSDNAMLFCKHWNFQNDQDEVNTASTMTTVKDGYREKDNLDRMLKRAVISTSIATLATTCSFIISAISKVIAVRCFCIFATLSVVTNYLLIVLLLPPALILDFRFSEWANKSLAESGPRVVKGLDLLKSLRLRLLKLGALFHSRWIFNLVVKYKFYFIITFITLLSCSSILVFHRPTLQPSDEEGLQLLSSKHAFEQYDRKLRKEFPFEKIKMGESPTVSSNVLYDVPDTLPIRIVFGVLPVDNGNHLDPNDRGSLTFDTKFDMTDRNVQIWLLEFCQKLRQQRFIHPSLTPDLSNCFMDTFKSWMDTRNCKDPIQSGVDRSPCCQTSEFPYSSNTFNKCIGEAVNIMRKTPKFQPNLMAGVRFFKNSTKIAAFIIEYQSNRLYSESFTKMDRFFTDIDEWVSWQINNTAPASLRSGWFISSNLELLALQTELDQSTTISILLEVIFAMVALMVGTRDTVLTVAGTLAVGTIIIVTVAVLILLKWTLGVAESILISLTIGLSIDFALHYSVAYSESRKSGEGDGVIHGILVEVGGPIALATVTTSLAGFVIVWSDILAYQQLGIFLMLIALASWIVSTFFLLPMLATIGSLVKLAELYARLLVRQAVNVLIDRV